MRYHWGLAVGHVYTHHRQCTQAGVLWPTRNHNFQQTADSEVTPSTSGDSDRNSDSGSNGEYLDEEGDDSFTESDETLWSDEGELLEFQDMYGEDVESGYED